MHGVFVRRLPQYSSVIEDSSLRDDFAATPVVTPSGKVAWNRLTACDQAEESPRRGYSNGFGGVFPVSTSLGIRHAWIRDDGEEPNERLRYVNCRRPANSGDRAVERF